MTGEDTTPKPGAVCANRVGLVLVGLHALAAGGWLRQNSNR
jgi:hypothetical protein